MVVFQWARAASYFNVEFGVQACKLGLEFGGFGGTIFNIPAASVHRYAAMVHC